MSDDLRSIAARILQPGKSIPTICTCTMGWLNPECPSIEHHRKEKLLQAQVMVPTQPPDLRAQLTAAQARVAELEKELAAATERSKSGWQLVAIGIQKHSAMKAECDALRTRAEKAEGDARWFEEKGMWMESGDRDEWKDRAKPYETP